MNAKNIIIISGVNAGKIMVEGMSVFEKSQILYLYNINLYL